MSTCHKQALIDAPVESIWDLVGDPDRHPEWWPRVIEVNGERYSQGDEYVQITRGPIGREQTTFLVESRDDLREICLRCQDTGAYARWMLTGAQGGTFVDLEMGMEPRSLTRRIFSVTIGPRFFRRWAEQSLEGLNAAACPDAATHGATAGAGERVPPPDSPATD